MVSLALILGFAAVEAAAGWWAGSLALMADAGHMLSDAGALAVAALAAWIARRPPSLRHSYGLGRAEVVAALLNGFAMVALVIGLVVAAVRRLHDPQPVAGGTVMAVAAAGLAVNVVVALRLSHGGHDLNVRAALLHVVGDLLGSVAALLSGAVVHFTGWTPIDPLLTLLIAGLILFSTVRLLLEALHVLLEGVPHHLDLAEVGRAMAAHPGVASVHDLHIWSLGSGQVALSAHVVVRDLAAWLEVLQGLQRMLAERYGIGHVTLQPEPDGHGVPLAALRRRSGAGGQGDGHSPVEP
ncbi:cation diffusion facilitator family transporter [Inmirania thermothiophila]|uniref:Cobalt-zinc-cadmium efflux system protein n=1 Tax=Inmirania thermothiophila TaxID=1750597 RepID=A0A3N1Y8A8_9GAMM|nr:cation diffusion facilitator family transporter [Inmirania thermothiophila]ROR34761.1 cobalt-zinc-cadmium efflux system protein [Inmirania thermothiophila]